MFVNVKVKSQTGTVRSKKMVMIQGEDGELTLEEPPEPEPEAPVITWSETWSIIKFGLFGYGTYHLYCDAAALWNYLASLAQ